MRASGVLVQCMHDTVGFAVAESKSSLVSCSEASLHMTRPKVCGRFSFPGVLSPLVLISLEEAMVP